MTPLVNKGVRGSQAQDLPFVCPSLRISKSRSLYFPRKSSIKLLDPSPRHDLEAVLEHLEDLEAVVTRIISTSRAGAATESTRKRKVLDPPCANANALRSAPKRVKRDSPEVWDAL